MGLFLVTYLDTELAHGDFSQPGQRPGVSVGHVRLTVASPSASGSRKRCTAGSSAITPTSASVASPPVIAVDMTAAMREKATAGAAAKGLSNVEVREGFAEGLPVADGSVDVVISNGVINLTPDKAAVMREIYRTLRPGGRVQIADILVHREVPQDAKDDIDLWSG